MYIEKYVTNLRDADDNFVRRTTLIQLHDRGYGKKMQSFQVTLEHAKQLRDELNEIIAEEEKELKNVQH